MKVYNSFIQGFLFLFSVLILGQNQKSIIGDQKWVVSLKDFGAKGDGIADDSDSFQKAVDFCEKNKRKTLFIPFGKFLLKKSVSFKTGGLQLIGEGALLREESWLNETNNKAVNINSSELIIPKNNTGIIFDKNVKDPIRIADIQFSSLEKRQPGNTTAILFQSEWDGPVWPFIIERCHFTGFNFAIKFKAQNQYLVAFVQLKQNAFNQNDECVFFSDIQPKDKQAGIRNLAWGFTFENNMCHDNSRIIRGAFAKDAVNIRDNNMEGNIKYSDGRVPNYLVDIEVSNATVNFEGNHFESIISDAVYVSSVFKDENNNYLPVIRTTALNPKNKIFIKGNNFDGVSNSFKPFTFKGLLVYNYDQVSLFLDECDLRLNESNEENIYLTDFAKKVGTVIKIPVDLNNKKNAVNIGSYRKNDIANWAKQNKQFTLVNSGIARVKEKKYQKISANDQLLVAEVEILNENGTQFLGISTIFEIEYILNGKKEVITKSVRGNYGYKLGRNKNIALIPNCLPSNAQDAKYTASLDYNNDIIGKKSFYLNIIPKLYVLNSMSNIRLKS